MAGILSNLCCTIRAAANAYRKKTNPMQENQLSFVFWANHLDEFAATAFVTEIRRIGLPVKIVGIHRQVATGSFGMGLTPDLSLEEATPQFHRVCCMIFPGSSERLQAMRQHPRLNELLSSVTSRSRWIVTLDADTRHQTSRRSNLLTCPTDERIIAFAKWLAQQLSGMVESSQLDIHPHGTRAASHLPPPVSVAHAANDPILYVAAQSRPHAVATAIANQLRDRQQSDLQAIGAGAVYQMVKAAIVAQKFLEDEGISLICVPRYVQTDEGTNVRTAVRMTLRPLKSAVDVI